MAEYIERIEALAIVDLHHGARQAYHKIRNLPAADVAPVVRAKWEDISKVIPDLDGDWLAEQYRCPICGRIEYIKQPYCNCGARMDGDGNG